jgi:crossover junction endodeoxyribonuclease RuvC
MRVIGFDPGTAATGYGIVLSESGRLRLEDCGVWRPGAALSFSERLEFLLVRALDLIGRSAPAAISIETVFAGKNAASAMKLSHARGVLMAAAARCHVPVFEYEPRLVKKALVGYGNAEKRQVRSMVLSLLARQRARVALDATDALAVAVCHVHACPAGTR